MSEHEKLTNNSYKLFNIQTNSVYQLNLQYEMRALFLLEGAKPKDRSYF